MDLHLTFVKGSCCNPCILTSHNRYLCFLFPSSFRFQLIFHVFILISSSSFFVILFVLFYLASHYKTVNNSQKIKNLSFVYFLKENAIFLSIPSSVRIRKNQWGKEAENIRIIKKKKKMGVQNINPLVRPHKMNKFSLFLFRVFFVCVVENVCCRDHDNPEW